MSILVVVEHDGMRIRSGSRSAVTVARELAGPTNASVELLVLGSGLDAVAADAARFGPVLAADASALAHPLADRFARVIADVAAAKDAATIVAASTTFSKDILPRAAALLQAAVASDVVGYSFSTGELLFRRPIYAGGAIATIALAGRPQIVTIRASAFPPADADARPGTIERVPVDEAALPKHIEYVGLESRATSRPDVGEARVVVSGGRAFRSSDEFEAAVGRLADALGGATGCTRALVDAGIAPNEWQVGQTGKVVAPELYVALGISGAVQHLAGMKNSRVIVAVNSDPQAPIFSVANYGLVGDVREVVPQIIEQLATRE